MAQVHSFDVFDTALVRKVATPTDLFRLIGSRIAKKAGIPDQTSFVEDFLVARVRAEQQEKRDREETTIDRIWLTLGELMPRLPAFATPRDELDAEAELLQVNAAVASHIRELRSTGARIIFTSDTYLPESFVREQLLRHGLAQDGEALYVSSSAGVTKRHGGLFEVILDREGIAAKDLHHYGDNRHSDVTMPWKLGIGATLLTRTRLNTWERGILSKDLRHRTTTSLLAGSMRAFRLRGKSTESTDELVATLLAPTLLVWASWVLNNAQRDGVRRLYFVSRQGYLLCRAARVLAPHFGNIDCRDLIISRQSILLPSADEISPTAISWLRRPRPVPIGELVSKLGLKWSDVALYFSQLARDEGERKLLVTDYDWEDFWKIVQNASVSARVQLKIHDMRTKVLAYLRAEGLYDGMPIGIVDIGWYMAVQSCLQRLLKADNCPSTLNGYFLGLCRTRMPPAATGQVSALFYQQAFDHDSVSPEYEIFRRIDILDHIFGLAPHGTVQEYTFNGSVVTPVCSIESAPHVEFVSALTNAIELFCRSNLSEALDYSDDATAREIIDALFSAWCNDPNVGALEALSHVVVTDGTDGVRSQPLLRSWRFFEAAGMLIPGRWRNRLKVREPHFIWPEAALRRSRRSVQLILQLSTVLRNLQRAVRSPAATM